MVIIRSAAVSLLAFALADSANALSAPIGRRSNVIAPPQARAPPPPPPPTPQADGNVMAPPYGAVAMNSQMEATEGRIPGSYKQAQGGNWWDQAGNPGTYQSINTSSGNFLTYTEAEAQRRFSQPINNNIAPEPSRIPGSYNQQATGNWWDRAGTFKTHQSINTSSGTFTTYTEANREPVSFNQNYNHGPNGDWWDRAGNPGSHGSINTSAGFETYTDAQERRRNLEPAIVGTNRDPEPVREAGSYNQQGTSSWWDRPGSFNSYDSIRGSSGTFQTHTDMIRERTKYS